MNVRRALLASLAAGALSGGALFAVAAPAGAATASYEANLASVNNSGASGTLMLTLNGDQATITEQASGLAATFSNAPYPHVQHIHINGAGTCPTTAADTNGDGVISTTEGAPAYGPIGTTLSTSGPTTPAAGTTLNIAPSGATINYSRTFTLDAATVAAIQANKAVIVVHGLDPSTLTTKAQGEKSDLVPSLPLAATSPALCGVLAVSQTAAGNGGVATGAGGTSGTEDTGLLILGGSMIAGAAIVFGSRRYALKSN
ncbi:MAG TPA: hypothetical protein VH914_11670 [Acidimicrobiia bacterium]|jgi:hypothetical protein|nr:hypothetical protein [Acidimicrobiia bacterium]